MKRIINNLLLLSLLVGCTALIQAQTRPRRVGQNRAPAPVTSPATSPVPSTSRVPATTGSTRPASPPVLGGATRTGGVQTTGQSPVIANNGPEEVEAGDVIKVNTTLVTLPVSVTDRDGRYIPNLRKEDFRLWEEGVEQSVAFFSAVDKPFSVVLMIDTSGSTRFRLEDIQDAAITFVNQLRRDDRVMIVSFDDRVRILSEFTNDRSRLRDAIRQTHTGDGTQLYDAVDLVINQRLSNVSGRKAVVLFTDGVDTTSRHASYASNIRDAEELDALVYPVQYDTYSDMGGGGSRGGGWPGRRNPPPNGGIDVLIDIFGDIIVGRNTRIGSGRSGGGRGTGTSRQEYDLASRYLHDLAERTGARSYQADSMSNLATAFSNIAEELRRQYSLGYYPKNPAQAGQQRQIRVRVNQPNLAVRTRDSYVFKPSGTQTGADTAQRSAPVLRKFTDEDEFLQ